jgi:hypothetical protein
MYSTQNHIEKENEMKHVMLMNPFRRFRAGFAWLALIALASLGNAPANAANAKTAHGHARHPFVRLILAHHAHANSQTAQIHDLLTAVHELTSYNGSEQTAIEHLDAWEQLWAEDATLVVNGTTNFVGRDAIMTFFANGALFNNNWVGLTPSFRTKVEIHGNTAEVYLECMFVNEDGLIVFPRAFHGTIRKSCGKWLFWRMVSEAAKPLFPDE